jgi:hypothetical protein
MKSEEAVGLLNLACRAIALALAVAAALKMGGVLTLRPGVIEMCAVSIALSLVK